MNPCRFLMLLVAALAAIPLSAQDRHTDSPKRLSERPHFERKQVLAKQMDLAEGEAKRFWPIYDAYHQELLQIDRRLLRLSESYAADYVRNAVNDARASVVIHEILSLQDAEMKLTQTYATNLNAALPGIKVARYLQLEYRIRTAWKYRLAERMPLARPKSHHDSRPLRLLKWEP
jgi:hypothetical protein